MALPINTLPPVYNGSPNYSGSAPVRAAALVSSADQVEAVASAQRDGRFGLNQSGFLKIPREVLYLQDERGAKIKSNSVSSTTHSDLDSDRLLKKIENTTHQAVDAIDGQAGGNTGGHPEDRGSAQPDPLAVKNETGHHGVATPGVLGSGSTVYQGVIAANSASLSGRNVSVLA